MNYRSIIKTMKKLNTRFINIDNFSKIGSIVAYTLATLLLIQLC